MPSNTGYADIAAHFRRLIRTGQLRGGDRLPSIRETKDEFGVSISTVSRAYRILRQEGLVRGSTGTGTIVNEHPSESTVSRVQLYAETGRALASNEESRITEIGTVAADETVAVRLDVDPGTPVHVRRRVVSRDGVPIHMSSSYYPAFVTEAVPELSEPVSTGGSRELAAERLGVPQDSVLEEVTSRYATEEEKSALGVSGERVIVTQVVRTVTLADGRVVEVAVKTTGGTRVLRWTTPLR